ncbi:hypothetical protein J7M00_03360 [bacterium]|nr:hypothetical protein [bacterium]
MPVIVRCGGCGHIFLHDDFDEVFKHSERSFIEVAEEIREENGGRCPNCGKPLRVPETVEIEPAIEIGRTLAIRREKRR